MVLLIVVTELSAAVRYGRCTMNGTMYAYACMTVLGRATHRAAGGVCLRRPGHENDYIALSTVSMA